MVHSGVLFWPKAGPFKRRGARGS